MQTEKQHAPEKIDCKLDRIDTQSSSFLRVLRFPNQGGADAHEEIEYAPNDGEQKLRRGKPRLALQLIIGQPFDGEDGG